MGDTFGPCQGAVGPFEEACNELDDDCDVLEQAAREAGLDVRPVDARQDLAWASSLPFGLAPRHLLS